MARRTTTAPTRCTARSTPPMVGGAGLDREQPERRTTWITVALRTDGSRRGSRAGCRRWAAGCADATATGCGDRRPDRSCSADTTTTGGAGAIGRARSACRSSCSRGAAALSPLAVSLHVVAGAASAARACTSREPAEGSPIRQVPARLCRTSIRPPTNVTPRSARRGTADRPTPIRRFHHLEQRVANVEANALETRLRLEQADSLPRPGGPGHRRADRPRRGRRRPAVTSRAACADQGKTLAWGALGTAITGLNAAL